MTTVGKEPPNGAEVKKEASQRRQQNSLGVVVHADMSPVRVCGCRRQVQAHIALLESLLQTTANLVHNATLIVGAMRVRLSLHSCMFFLRKQLSLNCTFH